MTTTTRTTTRTTEERLIEAGRALLASLPPALQDEWRIDL